MVGVTTDGAPAMVGQKLGLIHFLKNKLKECNNTNKLYHYHYIIHQEALIVQVLKMNNVMDEVIKTVNFIRKHALNHRQFRSFLDQLESPFDDDIYF